MLKILKLIKQFNHKRHLIKLHERLDTIPAEFRQEIKRDGEPRKLRAEIKRATARMAGKAVAERYY